MRVRIITYKERWQSLAYCTGLENQRAETYRGFESLPLRQRARARIIHTFCTHVRTLKLKGYKIGFRPIG